MRKKLTLLFALLCASVMGFAIDWSSKPWIGNGSGNAAYTNAMKIDLPAGVNVVNLQEPGFSSGNAGIYITVPDAAFTKATFNGEDRTIYSQGAGIILPLAAFTDMYTEVVIFNNESVRWTVTVYWKDGEDTGGGSGLIDPELSINSAAETLDASTSETFQIVATQSGDGAISYESSNAGIASVDNTGLVTAVGRGVATITVRTAETATYEASSKTLTVTVTGPINWEAVSWLEGSDSKYKAVVDPAGPNIINVQTRGEKGIYVGFPSADWGDCSLDASAYTTEGAGRWYFLSAFTGQENTFTQVCQGVTYTFDVYYVDGEPEDLTGWNIAKGKTTASGYDANNERTHVAANDGDKNTRWSSEGGIHYPASGAQDWWYVDLGGFYSVETIKILFEGAFPNDYDLMVSNNAVSWTIIGTYTTNPKVGNTNADYNEYDFSASPYICRYIKIFARNGANINWGISIWEFEVYGDHASIDDHNPPTMGTASLSGDPLYNQVTIAVTGTDPEDGVVTQFHVVDATHGVDQSQTAEAGVITVTGLNAETSYTFTITALDAAGNVSANSVNVAATTAQDTSIPSVAAPVPSATGKEIRPIYCDAFASILEHSFDKDGFAGMPVYMEKNISGDNCLIYDRSGSAPVFTTWGMYDDGANAIIAQSEYRGSGMGVDASAMEYLHIDIWSLQACNTILIRINDGGRTGDLRLSHDGSGWKSFDIPLSEFVAGANVDNVRWFKFEAFDAITGKVALDNVYFWKTAAGLHAVSAAANNASFGTASVVVTETGLAPEGGTVADGTEVTFTATANDGYIFVDWSNGNTNATFNATVDATMNLTANFRALGTTYCNTEMTAGGHTVYVTMKRSDVNEYTLTVRSTDEMSDFGGTVFYRPENILVKDVRNEGVLSDGNHTLSVTMESEGEPYFGTPLYVVFAGVGEVTYSQMQNVRPEYAIACDESVSVTSITLSQSSAKLLVGHTLTLTPTFTPAYATDRAITWETSDASVATVLDGVVTAGTAGTATITAKLTSNNSIYATCAITVVDALTEATWHGYAVATPPTESNILLTYSVTRDVDQHLTFSLTTDKNMVGFVTFINIAGVAHELTDYGAGHTATYTTTDTYEDNVSLNCMWDVRGAGYGQNFYFTYMTGSENQEPNVMAVYESQDNTSALTAHDNETMAAIIVNRSFTADNLYTLVLPFDVDAAQTAAKLPGHLTKLQNTIVKENQDLRVNFVDANEIEAGVPYLYAPSVAVANPVFEDVSVSKDLNHSVPDDGYAEYHGIYAPMDGVALHALTNAYVLGPDQYLYAVSDLPESQTMAALRAYFVLNFPSSAGAAPRHIAKVVFNYQETEVATGIENTIDNEQNTKILRDGQLLIIREGKTYNAQGQLIK